MRKSSLDMLRKLMEPTTYGGEDIRMFDSASCDVGGRTALSNWRLGHLYLTTNHLTFAQGSRKTFKLSLNNIKSVDIVKRTWIMSKKVKQICIVPKEGTTKQRIFYIAVRNPDRWKEAIEEQKPE